MSTNGSMSINLINNVFKMNFNSSGGYASGDLEINHYLTEDENTQFVYELNKLFLLS